MYEVNEAKRTMDESDFARMQEELCRVIARANRFTTVCEAIDALMNARRIWESMPRPDKTAGGVSQMLAAR